MGSLQVDRIILKIQVHAFCKKASKVYNVRLKVTRPENRSYRGRRYSRMISNRRVISWCQQGKLRMPYQTESPSRQTPREALPSCSKATGMLDSTSSSSILSKAWKQHLYADIDLQKKVQSRSTKLERGMYEGYESGQGWSLSCRT